MTTDTSAEALERLLWEEPPRDCKNTCEWMDGHAMRCHDVIRALAAEKRRAREGVTDDVVERAYRAFYRIADDNIQITSLWPIEQWRAALESVWPDGRDAKSRKLHIVFDGPSEPTAGCFVEVETLDGKSIRFGEWKERPDGYWALEIDAAIEDTDHAS